MKKFKDFGVYFLAFLVVLGTLTISAQSFSGPPVPETVEYDNISQVQGHTITASQVRLVPNKTYAIMRGNIVESLKKEHYTFRDSTGEIDVKIKTKYWEGPTAGLSVEVEILVEVENKKDGRIEVEAKSVREI